MFATSRQTSLAVPMIAIGTIAACALGPACSNFGAPETVTPEVLCEQLATAGCPQGLASDCATTINEEFAGVPADCREERNELLRCYYVDLPRDADVELANDPFACVLSGDCEDETNALCSCQASSDCSTAPIVE